MMNRFFLDHWRLLVASTPVMIWVKDSFYGLVRVQGDSMAPTLQSGDVLLVRKSDGWWHGATFLRQLFPKRSEQDQQEWLDSIQYERFHCHHGSAASSSTGMIRKPPMMTTNEFVVFHDPEKSSSWNIKRVIGLGGQVILFPTTTLATNSISISSTNQNSDGGVVDDDDDSTRSDSLSNESPAPVVAAVSVPPYNIHVQGDNLAKSVYHASVRKKTVVGIAEYRFWPPSRIGWLHEAPLEQARRQDSSSTMYPYSYWP